MHGEHNSIMYIYLSLLLADLHYVNNVWKKERSKKKHGEGSYHLEKNDSRKITDFRIPWTFSNLCLSSNDMLLMVKRKRIAF